MILSFIEHNKKLLQIYSIIMGVLLCSWFNENLWLLVTTGVVAVCGNLFIIGKQLEDSVPLPRLILFNYLFQHFLASLVLYYFPPLEAYDIGFARYPAYLAYAIPCCLALYLGICLAESSSIKRRNTVSKSSLPVWAKYPTLLFWIGVSVLCLGRLFQNITALNFVLELLANLRYVGLFTLILSGKAHWWKYAAFLFVLEFVGSTSQGMFGNLVLWGGAFFLVLAFRYEWQRKAVLGLVASLFILIVFQSVKVNFRELTWGSNLTVSQKITIFGEQAATQVVDLNSILEQEMLPNIFIRFNQGWIVDRVMSKVPSTSPYASGETIWKGLYAAFVPRFVDPDKSIAGGVENFERFTGLTLGKTTSMTIGVVGELYANFGVVGGIIGMGIFGFILGILYRMLSNKAAFHPVWYAWGPFIGFYALKAEEGLMEIMTWTIKSGVVMALVIFLVQKFAITRKKRSVNYADGSGTHADWY